MAAHKLILIRHSLPEIHSEVPASEWSLSADGRARCLLLAEQLMGYHIQALACSHEPKAIQTAAILGERLLLPVQPFDGLHEHLRQAMPWQGQTAFETRVRQFFAQPDNLVFGLETAVQAASRFTAAIHRLLKHYPSQTVAAVSHGTVMALFAAWAARNSSTKPEVPFPRRTAQSPVPVFDFDPFLLWMRLEIPAYLIFSLPDLQLEQVVEQVA